MYEQYFMGIQKMPPAQLHKDIERKIREFTQRQIRNTALRFRFTTLSQKFGSYNSYWRRTLRRIEAGTYIRDIHRVKRRAEERGQEIPEEILASMPKLMRERIMRDRERLRKKAAGSEQQSRDQSVKEPRQTTHTFGESDLAGMDVDTILQEMECRERPGPLNQGQPQNGTRAPAQDSRRSSHLASHLAPPQKPPPGMTEDESRKLYRRYVQARKLVGERTDNLSYDRLMRTLNRQAPQIMQQHQATGVQFGIVIKGDKVVLKAKPKK